MGKLRYSIQKNFLKQGNYLQKLSLLGLFLTALLVRLPWLWLVPRYIDELKEVSLAYQIFLGKVLPLHNMAHEIGAWHNYILAGIFKILGPSIYWPRLYVAFTSAFTVVLLYYLGKLLGNQWTGIIASGLLLTNGMHILVTHMAWSNCTTPFFFSLALLATVKAENLKSGVWLVWAGFLWSITLQTHSSVIIYILVVSCYILTPYFRKKTKIKSKYYFFSMLAFLGGYSNMIYYNLISRGDSIRWIFYKDYTLETSPTLYAFGRNFLAMFTELIRTISSTYPNYKIFWIYLTRPAFLGGLFLITLGIILAIRQRKILPVLILAGGFLIIPWINHRYDFFIVTRYIMPLVLCAVLLIAYGITGILKKFLPYIMNNRWILIFLVGLLITIVGLQAFPFYQYCNRLTLTDMSNFQTLKLLDAVTKLNRNHQMTVLIDQDVHLENNPLGPLLTISRYQYQTVNSCTREPERQWLAVTKKFSRPEAVVILSSHTFQQLRSVLSFQKINHFSCSLILNCPFDRPRENTIYITIIKM